MVPAEKNPAWVATGKRVRAARIAAGYEKMGDLTAQLRLPRFGAQTLGAVERGERELFDYEAAEIARVAGFDSAWLYGAQDGLHVYTRLEEALDRNTQTLNEIRAKLATEKLREAARGLAVRPERGSAQPPASPQSQDDRGSEETG